MRQIRSLTVLGLSAAVLMIWAHAVLAQNSAHEPGNAGAEAGLAPTVVVDAPVFDFGEVAEGATVEHEFVVRNIGTKELTIQRVHAACGCTAAVLESNIVPSGGQTKLRVRFVTLGFGGYKEKTIRIYTDDPKQASLLLAVKGVVRQAVVVDPPRVYFGRVKQGETPSVRVEVDVSKGADVKVTEVLARSDDLVVEAESGAKGKETKKFITARLKATAPLGVFRSRIVVKTTSKDYPVLNIPVFARVVGDLEFVPSSASFGLLEGPLTEDRELSVELRNSGKQPVKVLALESSNPDVEARVNTLEEGRRYEIMVTIRAGYSGTLKSQVELTTDHQSVEQQRLKLPVYAIVSKKGA